MKGLGFLRSIIERLGKGIALVFVLVGIPVIVIGLILLLIPFIGWIFAIPILIAGSVITLIGIAIAAKTSVRKHHIHVHHGNENHTDESYSQPEKQNDELEVKGSLVCYRCGNYISENDMVCKECGARQ